VYHFVCIALDGVHSVLSSNSSDGPGSMKVLTYNRWILVPLCVDFLICAVYTDNSHGKAIGSGVCLTLYLGNSLWTRWAIDTYIWRAGST